MSCDKGASSTPLAKKAMMATAGNVLAHPATYRVAIKAANSPLKLLPRFAIYNSLSARSYKRRMPCRPAETFHVWHRRIRGKHGKKAGKVP